MKLSVKTKEAIKVALAMTIAYAIALSQDWDRPYWAGFAVAFCSLASIGQSMNKAALRMFGTLLAVAISLVFIAQFAQQRWAFILCLSLYGGFCAYMMSGSKRAYFWQVACFVVMIICMDAGPDPVNAFQTAVLRAQQTGLGILVYSLVAVFLWPSFSVAPLNTASIELARAQQQLFQACLGLMNGRGDEQSVQHLAASAVQAKTHFDQLLDAAETESSEVWESRAQWRSFQQQAGELIRTLEQWRISLTQGQTSQLQSSLPNLHTFGIEIDRRLGQVASMLDRNAPKEMPQAIDLSLDKSALHSLSHFQKGALVLARSNMEQLQQVTLGMFQAVSTFRGYGAESPPLSPTPKRGHHGLFLPDPDRLGYAIRYMAMLWLAWFALIYVADLPGGAGLLSFVGAIGIAVATMPQLSVSKLMMPAAGSVLFAAFVYIFVMPTLSSFYGLGLLIFATTFAICYLFANPKQGLGRSMGLAMFVTIASISNQQSYHFLSVATTALMFPLVFLIIAVSAYIPWSLRPERVFVRLLRRFFRSSEYLLDTLRGDTAREATRLERWKKEFHKREIATLPGKLASWAPSLDNWVLASNSMEQVQSLLSSMQLLGYRIEQIVAESGSVQASHLRQNLTGDFRVWRGGIQIALRQLAEGPAAGEQEKLRVQLDGMLDSLESSIQEALGGAPEDQYSDREAENFYRLLDAYRGLSEALVDYAGRAVAIDWTPWRQERFA